MDDLCIKIDIVLNECSRYLCNFEKKEFHEYKIVFIVSGQNNILCSSLLIKYIKFLLIKINYRI